MKALCIRPERPGDEEAISALVSRAFLGLPYSDGSEARIVESLRRDGALAVSLVAEEAGALLGHVAFSSVTLSTAAAGWLGLGPLAVTPDQQRRGIGSQLVREGLERLREMGAAGCVVLGDSRFYSRFGFELDPEIVLPGFPAEFFQALILEGPHPGPCEVSYHAAFSPR